MSDDVGRNDPCPCGSGAKYKHCCLRKQTKKRDSTSKSQPDWQEELGEHYEAGRWTEALDVIEEQLLPSDDSLDDVEDRLGPKIREVIRGVLLENAVLTADLAKQNDSAEEALEFFDFVFGRLSHLDSDLEDQLRRHHIDALVVGERHAEAAELVEQLIDDPEYQTELVELLREHPKLQADYDGPLEGSYDTPKGRDEWDDFWDAYPGASRDESLDMIESQIREGSYFDEEWIESALLESFEEIVNTPQRAERWRGLIELTRQKYPEEVSNVEHHLIFREIDAAARYDMDLQTPLDRLFESPIERIEMIGDLIPRLAYAGRPEDMTSRLRESAEDVDPHDAREFLDGAGWCAPYGWLCERANDDLDCVPDTEDFDDALGPLTEHVIGQIRDRVFGIARGFFGEFETPDPHDESLETFDTIGLRFGRQLVESSGRCSSWSGPKALYAAITLQLLINSQIKYPPKQRQTSRYGDGQKIDQIRSHLQDASPLVPDPGVVAERVRDAALIRPGRLGHGSAMAVQIILEWFHFLRDHDLGVSKMVTKSIARHLPPALPRPHEYAWFGNRDLEKDMREAFASLESV